MFGDRASDFILWGNLFVISIGWLISLIPLQALLKIEVEADAHYRDMTESECQGLVTAIIDSIFVLYIFNHFIKFEWAFFILLLTSTLFFLAKQSSKYWVPLPGSTRIKNKFTISYDYTRLLNAFLGCGKLWYFFLIMYAASIETPEMFSFMAKGG